MKIKMSQTTARSVSLACLHEAEYLRDSASLLGGAPAQVQLDVADELVAVSQQIEAKLMREDAS